MMAEHRVITQAMEYRSKIEADLHEVCSILLACVQSHLAVAASKLQRTTRDLEELDDELPCVSINPSLYMQWREACC